MDLYETNLDAIQKRNQHFYDLLLTQPTQEKLMIKDDSTSTDKVIDMLKQHENTGVIVILGFGEGDLASRALDILGKGFALVIYEFNHEQFNKVLCNKDFTKLWKDDRVILILEENEGYGFLEYLRKYIFGGRLWMLIHPESDGRKVQYDKICENIAKYKALFEVNIGTQVGMGKHFMNSLMENVPEIIKKHGVGELRDIYKDMPCVCISPGPSLKKDIDNLKANRDKAIYVAVDSVTPFLMEHDFLPDFICGIDPLEDNARLFTDPRLKDVPLIAIMQYTPEVIRTYPGQVFISSQYGNQIFQWLGSHWDDRGVIDCPGGSVSHFALGIAEYLGCNPISIIGQDLCFGIDPKDGYYCSNIGEILDLPDKPLDRKQGGLPIKNMHDEDVLTTGIFIAFKMWLEAKFEAMKTKKIYNLSDGGLHLEYTLEAKFADFIQEHGQVVIKPEFKLTPLTGNKDGIVEEMTVAKKLLTDITEASHKVLKVLHQIQDLIPTRDKEAINKLVNEAIELKKPTEHPFIMIIFAYHFKIDIYLNRFEVREVDNIPDKFECLTAQTDKGINYYGELIEASELFVKQLDKVLNTFGVTAEHKEAVNG